MNKTKTTPNNKTFDTTQLQLSSINSTKANHTVDKPFNSRGDSSSDNGDSDHDWLLLVLQSAVVGGTAGATLFANILLDRYRKPTFQWIKKTFWILLLSI